MINNITFPPLIGHRGVKELAPENTFAGFERAAELGLTWIEIDTTLCGSGECVIMHDDTLDRCSNGHGALTDFNFKQLQQLDVGNWFAASFQGEQLPSLSQALIYIDRLGLNLNLEIKTYQQSPKHMAQAVCHALSQVEFSHSLVISSFCHDTLAELKALRPDVAIGVLFEDVPSSWLGIMQRLNAVSLHCDSDLINEVQAKAITAAGYPLLCYTVNNKKQAQRLWQMGATSIFTDNPLIFSQ
ncbi:glycerophosphodiester phosphodiesterase family protein [Motilimonas sp. 1_MG-2023]|uniref:glycerophosphodiester phosphodiesterase family protein n=1 Tax=Motilimonas sp. 1_MG-2023 TaxID=3062672 RepID=UPI0026E1C329|nr:glycerophosphodiester phosphodiesterase family protein [Motilimonas sp. 1_MG-2023]MDO6524855.1 glycerophosphodiester phosphodiesterase family protein [Motilimonas sp. 1_MG-2023]